MNDLNKVMSEIKLIKQSILTIEKNSISLSGWIPKRFVLRFFDYGDTQLRQLEQQGSIKVSMIGRRKFYFLSSIVELLEKNIKTK
jgi:hypothetical protein